MRGGEPTKLLPGRTEAETEDPAIAERDPRLPELPPRVPQVVFGMEEEEQSLTPVGRGQGKKRKTGRAAGDEEAQLPNVRPRDEEDADPRHGEHRRRAEVGFEHDEEDDEG